LRGFYLNIWKIWWISFQISPLGAFANKHVAKINNASVCASTLKYIMCNVKLPRWQVHGCLGKGRMWNSHNKIPIPFWKYIKAKCLSKQKMWDFDHHNLSNVSQNTNFMIDDYHSNLKASMKVSKGRTHGCWGDLTIQQIIVDVF
jgi:hypothetical protein